MHGWVVLFSSAVYSSGQRFEPRKREMEMGDGEDMKVTYD